MFVTYICKIFMRNIVFFITGISELVMNSDDLAKNVAQSYNRSLNKSPSTSETEITYKYHEQNFFPVYPGLADSDNDEDGMSQSYDINWAHDGPFGNVFKTSKQQILFYF